MCFLIFNELFSTAMDKIFAHFTTNILKQRRHSKLYKRIIHDGDFIASKTKHNQEICCTIF